jgi:CheY-like chemotaxis protein
MDGCDLVMRFRQIPGFAHAKIVAITGLKEAEYKALALKAGCDAVVVKPKRHARAFCTCDQPRDMAFADRVL